MADDVWMTVGVAMVWAGLTGLALLWLFYQVHAWRRRRKLRPDWARMLADTEYFHHSLCRIFVARGYRVDRSWVITDRIERQQREVVLALTRRGEPQAALCGRWVIPITSEIVSRFEEALARTNAQRGLIVTTSHFTEAAQQRATAYTVELVDGDMLQRWIAEAW